MPYSPLYVPPKLYDKRGVIAVRSFDKNQGRPQDFELDMDHPLAKGLVFAGLGRSPGSVRYNDSSGKGNTGTLTGMNPKTDWVWSQELGRWVLDFEAGSQAITTTSNVVSVEYTAAMWIKGSVDSWGVCYLLSSNDVNYWRVNANTSMTHYAGNAFVEVSPATVPIKTWTHVCMVRSAGGLQLVWYRDGVAKETDDNASTAAFTWNTIGNLPDFSGDFTGSIADPVFYNRALTLPEIQILARRSDPFLGGLIKPPSSPHFQGVTLSDAYTLKPPAVHVGNGTGRPQNFTLDTDHPLAKGLVFAGLGNAPGSTRCNDSSGKGNTGTLTNMDPATDWVWSQELGRWVLDFDPTNDTLVSESLPKHVSGVTAATLSCWMKKASATYIGTCGFDTNTNYRYIIQSWNDGNMYCSTENGAYRNPSCSFSPIIWTHFSLVFNGALAGAARLALYINATSTSLSAGGGDPPTTLASAANLGTRIVNKSLMIGDLLFHNRAISPAEIQILANRSDPMLDGLIVPADNPSPILPLPINDRHWVGRSPDWHSADNWSRSQGGRGGAGVPNEKTNVFFDSDLPRYD